MDNLIRIIDEFIVSLSGLRSSVQQELLKLDEKASGIEKKEAGFLIRNNELDAREKEIAKVENVIALEQSAKEDLKEAAAIKSETEKNHNKFSEYAEAKERELTTRENDIFNSDKLLKKEWDALKKAKESLEKDIEGYKNRVAKFIVEGADKKVR